MPVGAAPLVAAAFEKLHVASEKPDREGATGHGGEYLSVSRQIVR